MELIKNPELKYHQDLINYHLQSTYLDRAGVECLFASRGYFPHMKRIKSDFYLEAVEAFMALDTSKKVENILDEIVYYNQLFLDEDFQPLKFCSKCLTG